VLDFGFSGLLVREVAGNYNLARKYVGNMLSMKIILAVLCYGVLGLLVILVNKPAEIKLLILIAGVQLIFITSIDFCAALFQAFDKIYLRAVMRLLYHSLLVIFCIFVFLSKGGVKNLLYAYAASAGLAFLVSFIVAQVKFVRFPLGFDFAFWKKIIIQIIPFALIAVISTVYSRVDMVMLSFLKGEAAVGIYAAANNMYAAVQMMPILAISGGYAVLARLFKQDNKKFKTLCMHYFWALLSAGFFLGLGCIVLARPIVHFVFGSKFAQSGPVLQMMGASLLVCTMVYFLSYFFSVTRMQNYLVRVLAMAFVLNVGLNYILIGKFSYLGAVAATVIAQFYQAGMLLAISYYKGYRVWKA
jgi:O-antigen/teichoic acid export membrane protein